MAFKRSCATSLGAGSRSAVGRVPESCQKSLVRYPVWPHIFISPSADLRRAFVSYWRKYVHEVLVNCLGGLSLPRKSVVRLTDRHDTTLDVYRGHKTTTQQHTTSLSIFLSVLLYWNIRFCSICIFVKAIILS